jgi:type IV fimbrial biogenesis protein FimT
MSSKQQGLTLIELMVTLAVAIILVAVGMPLFSNIADNNRAVAQTNALVTALNLARSEAVGRSADVTVCPASTNPPGATPACGTIEQWANGWFVFIDEDIAGAFDAGTDEYLRIWDAPAGNPVITVTGAAAARFGLTGATYEASTFEIGQADAVGNKTRCVSVTVPGNIRTVRGSCS